MLNIEENMQFLKKNLKSYFKAVSRHFPDFYKFLVSQEEYEIFVAGGSIVRLLLDLPTIKADVDIWFVPKTKPKNPWEWGIVQTKTNLHDDFKFSLAKYNKEAVILAPENLGEYFLKDEVVNVWDFDTHPEIEIFKKMQLLETCYYDVNAVIDDFDFLHLGIAYDIINDKIITSDLALDAFNNKRLELTFNNKNLIKHHIEEYQKAKHLGGYAISKQIQLFTNSVIRFKKYKEEFKFNIFEPETVEIFKEIIPIIKEANNDPNKH